MTRKVIIYVGRDRCWINPARLRLAMYGQGWAAWAWNGLPVSTGRPVKDV